MIQFFSDNFQCDGLKLQINYCNLFDLTFSEDIPKPPSDPAPLAKESQLIEDEAPWRRPTSIRLTRTNQNENPPKIRNYQAVN